MKLALIIFTILISSQVYSTEIKNTTVGSLSRDQCINSLEEASSKELIKGIVASFIIDTKKSNEYFIYCFSNIKLHTNCTSPERSGRSATRRLRSDTECASIHESSRKNRRDRCHSVARPSVLLFGRVTSLKEARDGPQTPPT